MNCKCALYTNVHVAGIFQGKNIAKFVDKTFVDSSLIPPTACQEYSCSCLQQSWRKLLLTEYINNTCTCTYILYMKLYFLAWQLTSYSLSLSLSFSLSLSLSLSLSPLSTLSPLPPPGLRHHHRALRHSLLL